VSLVSEEDAERTADPSRIRSNRRSSGSRVIPEPFYVSTSPGVTAYAEAP
jgi:hypothetical protein